VTITFSKKGGKKRLSRVHCWGATLKENTEGASFTVVSNKTDVDLVHFCTLPQSCTVYV
jgi:hypothetical protein